MEYDCKVPEYTPMEGYGIIYLYTLDDGKQYVGQTTQSIKSRHTNHICGNDMLFDKAIKEHRWSLEVIGEYPKSILNDKEMEEIIKHNSCVPNGYNNHEGRITHTQMFVRKDKYVSRIVKRGKSYFIRVDVGIARFKNLNDGDYVIVDLKKVMP